MKQSVTIIIKIEEDKSKPRTRAPKKRYFPKRLPLASNSPANSTSVVRRHIPVLNPFHLARYATRRVRRNITDRINAVEAGHTEIRIHRDATIPLKRKSAALEKAGCGGDTNPCDDSVGWQENAAFKLDTAGVLGVCRRRAQLRYFGCGVEFDALLFVKLGDNGSTVWQEGRRE